MRRIIHKYPILTYIVSSFFKYMCWSVIGISIIFILLELSGMYTKMERALDLKYSSPFIVIPIYGFFGLFVICLIIGSLLYFYKYKRSKTKGIFYKAFSSVLHNEQSHEH